MYCCTRTNVLFYKLTESFSADVSISAAAPFASSRSCEAARPPFPTASFPARLARNHRSIYAATYAANYSARETDTYSQAHMREIDAHKREK